MKSVNTMKNLNYCWLIKHIVLHKLYRYRDKNFVLYKDLLNINFNKTNMFLITALGVLRGDLIIYMLMFIYARVSAILGM